MNQNKYILAVSLFAVMGLSAYGITVDGTLDGAYGNALSVQTIATDYGSGTAASGGNQLDAAYGSIQGGNLYLFFAGNTSDGNSLHIYLSDGQAGGQSTFNVSGGSYTSTASTTLDGSLFSPDFSATQMIDVNTSGGTIYANIFDLVAGTGGYAGNVADAGGAISGVYSINVAVDNSSTAGASANVAPGALLVSTGWELAIPVTALNNASSIKVLADIGADSGGSGSLANQFLAPADVSGYPQTFDFSSTSGQYFTVAAVPEPSSMALSCLSGLAALFMFRRRS